MSVYHFPEWQDLLRRPGVRRYDVVPCESVAPSMRRATVVTWMVELSHLSMSCKSKEFTGSRHQLDSEFALALTKTALRARLESLRNSKIARQCDQKTHANQSCSVREFKNPGASVTWNLAGT